MTKRPKQVKLKFLLLLFIEQGEWLPWNVDIQQAVGLLRVPARISGGRQQWRYLMKNRTTLFLIAFVGLFGTGRMADAQVANSPVDGPPSTQKRLPAIDLEIPAKVQTATFALG